MIGALGDRLQRRQDLVRQVQWAVVALYTTLLVAPVVVPAAGLGRIAEALFWGLWWPGVILSMMLVGQFWCGVFCPDGTVTEFVSRHGKGLKPAQWLRWAGWPLAIYALLTWFSDGFQAHRSAWGTLLVVGGMSGLAILTGAFFGRSKRVWCRYLCPVMSIFSLLSRCSVLHFKVDRCRWDKAQKPVPKPVDCPLLLDVRRLSSNEKCNMCGRCSGHRGAVELAWRRPGAEIESLRDNELRLWDAVAVCYGLFGLSAAGIHWHSGLLEIAVVALVLGSLTAVLLLFGASGRRNLAVRLSYGLIPLAGLGLVLGAAEHSLALLAAEGLDTQSTVSWLRGAGVILGLAWSGRLGWVLTGGLPIRRRTVAVAGYGAALAVLACTIQFAPPSF
jgi:polyferredoxin